MNWYLKVMKENYFNFKGRARRKEYWMFVLVYTGIAIVVGFLAGFLAGALDQGQGQDLPQGVNLVIGLVGLAHLLPGIAVGVRRLHDIDKSGWWLLIGVIPLVGWIVSIYWACQEGETGPNRFGPDPKQIA